jgi:hypothetical protein
MGVESVVFQCRSHADVGLTSSHHFGDLRRERRRSHAGVGLTLPGRDVQRLEGEQHRHDEAFPILLVTIPTTFRSWTLPSGAESATPGA